MRLWYLSHRRPAKAQASLRIRAVSSAQSRQSLRCSHTWSMEVDEGSDQNQASSPTRWLSTRVWRMSLRRTISAIISWAGLYQVHPTRCFPEKRKSISYFFSGKILFKNVSLQISNFILVSKLIKSHPPPRPTPYGAMLIFILFSLQLIL